MRLSAIISLLCLVPAMLVIADDLTPLSPAEAAKKVNQKVVVAMEVKSTGGRSNLYLNSEEDFKDAKNFTIAIAKEHLEKFKKAGIEDPRKHFKGKLIHVTGTVVLKNEKPTIHVEEPDQIKVIEKDKSQRISRTGR